MKTLTRTIILTVALSLLAAGVVPAQTSQPPTPVLPTTPTPATPTPAPAPTQTSVATVNDNVYSLTKSLSLGSRSGSTGTVLVIPSEQTKTEDLLTINEDMNVMSRIFETSLEQDRVATVRSSIFFSRRDPYGILMGGSRGQIQSMYLQGYGALFMLKVDFPLSPSSDVQQEEMETTKEEQGDPVWQQMRQEMYEPQNVNRKHRTDQPEEKYDAEKVENLKTILIKALKHATNIRTLKPDESVILTVTGSGEITGTKIITENVSGNNQQVIVQEKSADGATSMKIVNGTALDNIGLSSPKVLVIRVKRSEIDAFAKGNLDFDQFRQRVQMFTYPLLGGADGYGGPFNPYIQLRSTGSSSRR